MRNFSRDLEKVTKKHNSMGIKNLFFILLLFCATFVMSVAQAQVYKLRTTSVAFKSKVNNYKWSNWSSWEDTSVLVVMDVEKDRITVYSKETQIYDIAENEGNEEDEDGDETWSYYCVNEDGLNCRVRFVKLNSQDGRLQLYIDFDDMSWVYNLYSLD